MKLGRRIRWTGTHRPKFSIQDCALVVVGWWEVLLSPCLQQ